MAAKSVNPKSYMMHNPKSTPRRLTRKDVFGSQMGWVVLTLNLSCNPESTPTFGGVLTEEGLEWTILEGTYEVRLMRWMGARLSISPHQSFGASQF